MRISLVVTCRFAILALLLTATVLTGFGAQAWAAVKDYDLDADEEKVLQELDAESAAKLAKLIQEIDQWQEAVEEVRRTVQQAQGIAKDAADAAKQLQLAFSGKGDSCDAVIKLARFVIAEQDLLAEYVPVSAEIKKAVQDYERVIKEIRYDAGLHAGVTEEEFREQALARIRFEVMQAILAEIQPILDEVEKLRDPAKLARDFLDDEIEKRFFDNPYELGSMQFKFVRDGIDRKKSLFSEDANISIVVLFKNPKMELQATGLYFKYQKDSLPEPQFDKLDIEQSAMATLEKLGANLLGDALSGLDLPVSLSNIEFIKPQDAKDHGCGVRLDVELVFLADMGDSFKAKSENIAIYADGTVELNAIAMTVPAKVTCGWVTFHGFSGGIIKRDGKPYEIPGTSDAKESRYVIENADWVSEAGTTIGFSALDPGVFCLEVRVYHALPPDLNSGITVVGTVKVFNQPLARIVARLRKDEVDGFQVEGEIWFPPPGDSTGIDQIINAHAKFKINGKGLTSDGTFELLKAAKAQCDLVLNTDGSGHFYGHSKVKIGSLLDAEGTLAMEFERGFEKFELETSFTQVVDLKLFPKTRASIYLKVSTETTPALVGRWDCLGRKGEIQADSLSDITPELLRKAIESEAGNIGEHIKQVVQNEHQRRVDLARTMRQRVNETFLKHAKGLIPGVNPDLDRLVNGAAEDVKQSLASGKLPLPPNPPGFNPIGGGSSKPKGPSAEELKREELKKTFDEKVQELVAAINVIHFDKLVVPPPAPAGTKPAGDQHELHFRFEYAVSASAGDGNGAIGLLAPVVSRSATPEPGTGRPRVAFGSAAVPATIEFTSLVANGPSPPTPKAKVILAAFQDHSGLNAEMLIRHKLQELIELYLPEVEIEGRRKLVEKRLAIRNPHGERVMAWVQLENRTVSNRAFQWTWDPAMPPAATAYRFVLAPKSERPVALHYEAGQLETTKRGPIHGRRIRIWLESESGHQWTENLPQDLWLVEPNPQLDGERAYDDEQMQWSIYSVPDLPKEGVFRERVVALRNDTQEKVSVNLWYLTNEQGVQSWKSVPRVELSPQSFFWPRNEHGLRIRAAQIQFDANSENLRYNRHERQPLWLVEDSPAGRAYRAEKLGTHVQAFSPPNAAKK